MSSFRVTSWALAVATLLLLTGCLRTPDRYAQSTLDVKVNPAAVFEHEGKPFCFAGTNNYYMIFKPKPMVDALLEATAAMNLKVMRTWAMLDTLDGKNPDLGGEVGKEGIYFHYWDAKTNKPAYNDGPNGLEYLDYVVHKADQLGIKLIMVMTNNWRDFGGMDQYLAWYGLKKHHLFYTDPRVKEAYKAWLSHVANRKNKYTGRLYKDEPAIFAWELANEPRLISGRDYDDKSFKSSTTITDWAEEMSAFMKSVDPNHMVSVGDEGFLSSGSDHWTYKANDGVDHNALIALPAVDFGTFHMYPEDWGTPPGWTDNWILDHLKVAREVNKPTVLEEYGWKATRDQKQNMVSGLEERETLYKRWNEIMLRRGGAGSMFWMLADVNEKNELYNDYDHFTLYRGRDTGNTIAKYAKRFAEESPACKAAEPYAGKRSPSPFVRTLRPGESELLASLGGGT